MVCFICGFGLRFEKTGKILKKEWVHLEMFNVVSLKNGESIDNEQDSNYYRDSYILKLY